MKIRLKNPEEFHEKLIRAGLSRRALADEAKIGETTVIQICNGDRNPSPRTAKRICDTLECSFDDIFEIVRPEAAAK